MNNYELRRIVFSNESNYTVINRKNKVIVRRHHNEKYHSRFIVPRLQGGIWGCITYDGPGLHMLWTNIDTLTLLKTI
jgi:hypothetical protein